VSCAFDDKQSTPQVEFRLCREGLLIALVVNYAAKLGLNLSPEGTMTLEELLEQKAELDRQIVRIRSEARQHAIDEIRSLMNAHGLTASDLSASGSKYRAPKVAGGSIRKPVAAKYKDSHGNSWTGRGLKPKWLTAALGEGKSIEDFKV